jgi:hypothetical protein
LRASGTVMILANSVSCKAALAGGGTECNSTN